MNRQSSETPGGRPDDDASRAANFHRYSDEALLEHIIEIEGGGGVDFPGFSQGAALTDGGRGFLSPGTLNDANLGELLALGSGSDWHLVFGLYGEIAVQDWNEMWASCKAASFTSLLKSEDSAYCLALLAWRHRRATAPLSAGGTVWRQLAAMSEEAREQALAAFGRDGAASCAYEGIEMDPALLSGSKAK